MLAPDTTEANGASASEPIDAPKLLSLPKRDGRIAGLKLTNEEAIIDRAEKIYLKRMEGKSYSTIGKELGISTATAHRDAKMICRMKYAGLIEKDETILVEQNHHIDRLLEKWLALAMEDFSVGETKTNRRGEDYDIALKDWESSSIATDKVIKLMEHQAKINGIVSTKQDRTPEEIGTSVAMSVFTAFEKMHQLKNAPPRESIEAQLIEES